MLIYHRLRVVTSLDSLPIQACSCLTAWTIEEASRPRIPRSTCAAARSSDCFQEIFTQGCFSVCVLLHSMFLSSTPRAQAGGHGSSSALCALTCSVAESSGKHIRPGEALFLCRSMQESKPKRITEGRAPKLVTSGAGEKSRD
jgi:hypothetical protein